MVKKILRVGVLGGIVLCLTASAWGTPITYTDTATNSVTGTHYINGGTPFWFVTFDGYGPLDGDVGGGDLTINATIGGISTSSGMPTIDWIIRATPAGSTIDAGLLTCTVCNVGISSFETLTLYIPDINAIPGLVNALKTNSIDVGFVQLAGASNNTNFGGGYTCWVPA